MDDFVVRQLVKSEEEWFSELAQQEIGKDYDDIDPTFSENILNAHFAGHDPLGYFTLDKRIWVGEHRGAKFGFFVTTRKRGQSIKMGPHVTVPEFRKRGLGGALRETVLSQLAVEGIRKVYVDMPAVRLDMLAWDLKRGMKIEAQLQKHYRTDSDEIVVARFLRPPAFASVRTVPKSFLGGDQGTPVATVRTTEIGDEPNFRSIILEALPYFHDEIDPSFVEAVFESQQRVSQSFRKKGRFPILLEARDRRPIGCAVAVPKRGGALKVGPICFLPNVDHRSAIEKVLPLLDTLVGQRPWRRIYWVVPSIYVYALAALDAAGYLSEGILRSPYKDGVDMIVKGKLNSLK